MKTAVLLALLTGTFIWSLQSSCNSGEAKLKSPPSPGIVGWYAKNWGLGKIDAAEAWAETQAKNRVVVATIDTGADTETASIQKSLSKFGFDFVKNSKQISDVHGHGTHIAGIIDAVSNQRALILPLKYYSEASTPQENLKNLIKAIRFAVNHKVKIINYSGGGPEFDEQEYLAVKYAERHGVLIVAAAGNENKNADLPDNYYYPAAYHLSNVLTVMGIDYQGNRVPSSNWGKKKVDIAAPGENIFSTLPGEKFGYMTGTSQATAMVTGVAALMWAENPELTPQDIKAIIIKTAKKSEVLKNLDVSGGSIDEFAAIKAAKEFGGSQ